MLLGYERGTEIKKKRCEKGCGEGLQRNRRL
jgi:hypothetical protein